MKESIKRDKALIKNVKNFGRKGNDAYNDDTIIINIVINIIIIAINNVSRFLWTLVPHFVRQ